VRTGRLVSPLVADGTSGLGLIGRGIEEENAGSSWHIGEGVSDLVGSIRRSSIGAGTADVRAVHYGKGETGGPHVDEISLPALRHSSFESGVARSKLRCIVCCDYDSASLIKIGVAVVIMKLDSEDLGVTTGASADGDPVVEIMGRVVLASKPNLLLNRLRGIPPQGTDSK
jgi:hypothetical protein